MLYDHPLECPCLHSAPVPHHHMLREASLTVCSAAMSTMRALYLWGEVQSAGQCTPLKLLSLGLEMNSGVLGIWRELCSSARVGEVTRGMGRGGKQGDQGLSWGNHVQAASGGWKGPKAQWKR